ncbi:MAG: Anti-sigma-B factor antagonist [candidate division BRC1 bacterium ADurb.BinA364]|nr:MAG: Anti-sigma-B factor antagonist [candidate division BRC1 bacterium ADurb.BinA364]
MSPKPLEITIRPSPNCGAGVVVDVAGFLDAHTVVCFESKMSAMIDNGVSRVVMNLEGLDYISSAGIGAIMSIMQKLRCQTGCMVLTQPREKVYKVLELLGFTKIFPVFGNLDDALAAIQSNAK